MWLAGALAHGCSRGELNARGDCAVAAVTAQAREGARCTAKGTRAILKPRGSGEVLALSCWVLLDSLHGVILAWSRPSSG